MVAADVPEAEIDNKVAEFVGSLRAVSKPEWNEAEEILGDRNDSIKAAIQRASKKILADPDRARAFDASLQDAVKSVAVRNFPEETAELLVKTVILAIYAANMISEPDYDALVEPMRTAWANVPTWAELQHAG